MRLGCHGAGPSRKKEIGEVKHGFLHNNVQYPKASFNLVTALDVTERVERDKESLESLLHFVKPGGWLLITVPALPAVMGRTCCTASSQKALFESAAARAGAWPRHNDHANFVFQHFSIPHSLSARWCKRLLKVQEGSGDAVPHPVINRLFARVFGRFPMPIGLSLVILLRKNCR